MALTTAFPTLGNTSWYGYAGALHDAAGVNDGAILVASADAPASVKEKAHYVCNGTNDHVEINLAIRDASPTQANDVGQNIGVNRAVPEGTQAGRVILSGGEFHISGSILMRTGVWLQGQGPLTFLRAKSNLTASTGEGTPVAMIKKFDQYVHLIVISDMSLYGNFGSGGPGHGIYLESGSDLDSYPASDPDTYDRIERLFIHYFTTGSRDGIHIAGKPQGRGVFIDNCAIRNHSGAGIRIDAPDGAIQNCNIGGGQYGIRMTAGNFRLVNNKLWYADTAGLSLENSRIMATGIEVQDCVNGVTITADRNIIEALHLDHFSGTGLTISANYVKVSFMMHHRSGGRYGSSPMATGVSFTGTRTQVNVQGVIDPALITTPVTGTTTGTANFIRIAHGSTLVSQG
jgi:hypothetical protein